MGRPEGVGGFIIGKARKDQEHPKYTLRGDVFATRPGRRKVTTRLDDDATLPLPGHWLAVEQRQGEQQCYPGENNGR